MPAPAGLAPQDRTAARPARLTSVGEAVALLQSLTPEEAADWSRTLDDPQPKLGLAAMFIRPGDAAGRR
jgi:hypothetical protein